MWNKPCVVAVLCGSTASVLLNASFIIWNSDGKHDHALERFFAAGMLMFPGFETGIFAVAANTVVFAIPLMLLAWLVIRMSVSNRSRNTPCP